MGFVVAPESLMSVSVCKVFHSTAFHRSICKRSFIASLIRPYHRPVAIDLVVSKLSFVYFPTIREIILTFSVKLPFYKLSFVGAVIKLKPSFTCFLATDVLAFVSDSVVVPQLDTFTMLLVVLPFS